ncbi:MAG: DUF5683 domain-containing protein [Balneolaceae bacterium]
MKRISFVFLIVLIQSTSFAQTNVIEKDYSLLENRYYGNTNIIQQDQEVDRDEFPTPRSVLFKSLMIPGWGQIVNRQVWKVPIVYGMFAGIGFYAYTLHQDYTDYRAAYYNAERGADSDFRFGPTPERLELISDNELQSIRNSLRNQRDMMFVVMALAYGLNAVDAYVFAHMRSFDVSDDLSMNSTLRPTIMADSSPGISLSFSFNSKK